MPDGPARTFHHMGSPRPTREPRKKHARPVKVRGLDEVNRFFAERAETVDISTIGARVVLRHPVGLDSQLHLSDVESDRSGVFLVVWQQTQGDKYHCGLVLADPGQPLWPQLEQVPDPGGRVDLCCADCGVADHVLVAVREIPLVREGGGLVLPCNHCGRETTWSPAQAATAVAAALPEASASAVPPVAPHWPASALPEAPDAGFRTANIFEIELFEKPSPPPSPPPVAPRAEPSIEEQKLRARLETIERELLATREKIAELETALKKARKEAARANQLEVEKSRLEAKIEKFEETFEAREAELKELSRERDQARKKASAAAELAARCQELEAELRTRDAEIKTSRREQEQLRKQVEAAAANAVRRAELEEIREKLDVEIADLREQLKTAQAEAEVMRRYSTAGEAGTARPSAEIAEQLTRAVSLLTVARAEAGLLGYAECDDKTRESIEELNDSLTELAQILAHWQKVSSSK